MRWNLYQRADTPYWQCRVVTPEGREIKRSTRKRDEQEAQRWAEKWVEELGWRDRLGLSHQTKTLEYAYHQMTERMDKSKRAYYNSAWRNYIEDKWGNRPVDQLKTGEIRQWLQGLALSPSRIAAIGVVLRQTLKYSVERDWVTEGRVARVPSTSYEAKSREAFTDDEMRELLSRLKAYRGTGSKKTDRETRFLLYYYVAFLRWTGARPGRELETLTWQRITEHTQGNRPYLRIRIMPENTKVRREREIVGASPLVPILEELSAQQIRWGNFHPTGFVFADSRGRVPRFSNRHFERALDHFEMRFTPDGKTRTLYSIRHQYITQKVRKGLPLSAIALQAGNSATMVERRYSKAVAPDFVDRFIE